MFLVILRPTGTNLIRVTNGSTGFDATKHDLLGTANMPQNALLGSLKNNGGHTPTIGFDSSSPARGAGNDATAPTTDQRGFIRVGTSDIGAFEFGGTPLQITSITHLANGDVQLVAHGAPNVLNTFEFSATLNPPDFQPRTSIPAGSNGVISFTDNGTEGLTTGFYRLSVSD